MKFWHAEVEYPCETLFVGTYLDAERAKREAHITALRHSEGRVCSLLITAHGGSERQRQIWGGRKPRGDWFDPFI